MDIAIQNRFITLWRNYFGAEELPLALFYTDRETDGPLVTPSQKRRCMVSELARAREGGEVLRFGSGSFACLGGRRYAGYSDKLRPKFEYFLSCGIPGEMEGERYKKTPELVREVLTRSPVFKAPARFIVFKRWDLVEENESPDAVVFFATPDVLAGLFTLASFDSAGPSGVIAPFSAGCGSIVEYPYLEKTSKAPRCVIGLFDPSARPFVEPDRVSFAAPWERFVAMVGNMEESFLTTPTWARIRERIARAA